MLRSLIIAWQLDIFGKIKRNKEKDDDLFDSLCVLFDGPKDQMYSCGQIRFPETHRFVRFWLMSQRAQIWTEQAWTNVFSWTSCETCKLRSTDAKQLDCPWKHRVRIAENCLGRLDSALVRKLIADYFWNYWRKQRNIAWERYLRSRHKVIGCKCFVIVSRMHNFHREKACLLCHAKVWSVSAKWQPFGSLQIDSWCLL